VTREGRRYGRIVIAVVLLATIGWLAFRFFPRGLRQTQASAAPNVSAPDGVRIKVEVLNATKIKGLARRATSYLRDRGFDVVGSGTESAQRATTLVLDRSKHPDWAHLVAKAMQAPVETRPDSSRYLDVTVILGADWRPPPLPFYP
jgi:hypothetical protein